MTNPEPVTVRNTADLLDAVPLLLGYHPTESLVILVLDTGRATLAARIDLSDADQHAAAFSRTLTEHGVSAVLIAYTERADHGHHQLHLLRRHLEAAQCTVADTIATDHHRWWTVDPTTDHQEAEHNEAEDNGPDECGCYHLDGVQRATSISAVTTALIARGCHALAHRDQLDDHITAPPIQEWPGLLRRHAQAGIVHASRSNTEQQAHLTNFLGLHTATDPADRTGPDRLANPDPDQLNEVMTAINDVMLRDLAWSTMTADNAHRHADLWAHAVRTTHPDYSAPALALHGFASWLNGDGTAANITADRLRNHHPDYTMGHLLEEILHRAVPHTLWEDIIGPKLRAELALPNA